MIFCIFESKTIELKIESILVGLKKKTNSNIMAKDRTFYEFLFFFFCLINMSIITSPNIYGNDLK